MFVIDLFSDILLTAGVIHPLNDNNFVNDE